MSPARQPVVKNRSYAKWGGVVFIVVGSALLYDAYENRGRPRPFLAKLLPGG